MIGRCFVATLVIVVLAACQPPVDTGRIVGQLESDRVELTAEFAEAIVSRPVVEGQQVTAGTVIVQQDTDRAAAKLRQAEATLAQHTARLDELIRGPRKEQIVAAQANVDGDIQDLEFRNTELSRAQTLLDRGLASPDVRDRAIAALDRAEARLEFDRAKLAELLTGTTVEELDQARASVAQTEAQLDLLRIDLRRHTIIAPVDGVLDSLLFEIGERPARGQPVAILLSGEQPYARVYIAEAERISVTPGVAASVFVDGMDMPLAGRVRWVATEAAFTPYFALTEHDRGRLSYLAKIDIKGAGDRLPDGVPVEVELLIADGAQ